MSELTLSQLAQQLQLEFTGPGETIIRGVCSLEEPRADCLSFVENPRQLKSLKGPLPAAIIAPPVSPLRGTEGGVTSVSPLRGTEGGVTPESPWDGPLLFCPKPRVAFAKAMAHFHPERAPVPGIHPTARVSPSANISEEAEIGPLCVVEAGAEIGAGSLLHARVVVGKDSQVGANCRILPGVVVGEGVRVGSGSVLDAHSKLTAGTIVEENVYIGVRCVLQSCRIGKGTKMDNLCFVGEGSQIGPHSIFVSKANVGKNVITGPYFLIAAISCVGDNVQLGPLTQVAGHSWVDRSWPEAKLQLAGEPAKHLKVEVKERALRLRAAKTYARRHQEQ